MSVKPERNDPPPPALSDEPDPRVTLEILRAIQEIDYGSVEIVVHGGRVVQIERKEKIRFGAEGSAARR